MNDPYLIAAVLVVWAVLLGVWGVYLLRASKRQPCPRCGKERSEQ